MGIELYWDDDAQTVMLAEFEGAWSWNELHAMLSTIKQISKQRQQVFGAIIYLKDGLRLPDGGVFNTKGLQNFRKILQLDPESKGPVAIVGMNKTFRSIFDAAGKIDASITSDVRFASTMTDARDHIYAKVNRLNETASA